MTTIGIDVGATELVLAIRHKKTVEKTKTFANNANDHQAINKLCLKYQKYGKVRIAIESTGSYHFDLAVALTDSDKNEVMVINPRATHSFAQADMKRNKTDKVDAETLALFAEKMDYPLWKRPSDDVIQLRYISRSITSYVVDKTKTSNHLHAFKSCSKTPHT